ncbi:hypothetical protein [Mycolicibacterium sphagni]|uniref:Uncharacterized protein n=1 Tax=Mycolicibacterium sphagni TaxID=1786 RepID=A0ABX2JZT1_9MYCO|nr:hypothetical protein [Mycolicibacterium sphagni]NTY62133.1 hypothetical protein [Mycolicibacterium sphagni]
MTTHGRLPDNTADWTWSDLSRSVFAFARALRAAELMPDDEDEYWEQPWKWNREHQLWVDAGEPASPDHGAPASLAWERFSRAATAAAK